MARIGATIGVTNSKLGSYLFTGPATIGDPVGPAATAVTDAATASTAAVALQTLLGTAMSDLATANTAAILVHTDDGLLATTATNGLVALMNITSGGTVAYTAATEQYSGAPAASAPTWTTGMQTALQALFNAAGAAIVTAVANLATANGDTYANGATPAAVTLLNTALADFKLIATTATNGLVAILSNQTFTSATCQLSGVPSASVTPSQAVMNALITILNTYGTAIVAANAAIAAIQVNMAALATDVTAVVTDTAQVVTDLAGVSTTAGNIVLSVDTAKVPTISVLEVALQNLLLGLSGTSYFAP